MENSQQGQASGALKANADIVSQLQSHPEVPHHTGQGHFQDHQRLSRIRDLHEESIHSFDTRLPVSPDTFLRTCLEGHTFSAEPVEQKGAEEATHRQYDLEAARHSPSPSPGQRENKFSSDSGSRAWGQASHRRLTDREYEAADRQDDDWVSLNLTYTTGCFLR